MRQCRLKKCPFHNACTGLPYICMWLQYLAIAALFGWLGYLIVAGDSFNGSSPAVHPRKAVHSAYRTHVLTTAEAPAWRTAT